MIHYRAVGITILLAALSLPAQAASGREAITAVQIAAAIEDAGIKASAAQITLLSDVVAKTSAPALKVMSIREGAGNLATVRMGCVLRDECLPFIVTVRRSQKDYSSRVPVIAEQQLSRRLPLDAPKSKVVLRTGSPAILLLDGRHVHIRIAVVCLENGSIGQTIRVTGKGRAQTYMAEVCSDGLLRGTL
ncbi:MAG: hypothetical protein M3Y72_27470 [Acidobacteriota bacterium]|nr:hypothetical protein [Acidobacteriota bacterium]